jgi:predicted RNA polymerase sigma factor
LGRDAEAVAAYDAAIALTGTDAERTFLERRRSALIGDGEPPGNCRRVAAPSPP